MGFAQRKVLSFMKFICSLHSKLQVVTPDRDWEKEKSSTNKIGEDNREKIRIPFLSLVFFGRGQ